MSRCDSEVGSSSPACSHGHSDPRSVSSGRWTSSTPSSGEVQSGSDPSSDHGVASWLWELPQAISFAAVPQLPMVAAAVPLTQRDYPVVDAHNFQLCSAQLEVQLQLDPAEDASSANSARQILGLGGADEALPVPSQRRSSRVPIVNGWLSKHPIFGSVLAPRAGVEKPPSKPSPQVCVEEPPALADAACSPLRTPRSVHAEEEASEDVNKDAHAPNVTGEVGETSQLLSLLRQLAEDTKARAAAEEERDRRRAAELESERSARRESAVALEAAASAAREAALRCAAVEEEAKRRSTERDDAAKQVAEEAGAAAAAARAAAAAAAAKADAHGAKLQKAEEARRRELVTRAMARWSQPDSMAFASCCLQMWHAEVAKEHLARKEEAHTAQDACAQTEEAPATEPTGCRIEADVVEDLPFAPVVAGAPPTIPGGALRALQGERVWLDLDNGAIHGAALWLSQKPPQASEPFLRTFDICLPWSKAHAPPGSEAASSSPTLDPRLLGEEEVLPPGELIRAEPLSLPPSPVHSRQGSPASGGPVAGSPKSSLGSHRSKSPLCRSPVARSILASTYEAVVEADDDAITPEKVLRRITNLMSEMTAMEASLGNLREELDSNHTEGKGVAKAPDIEAAVSKPIQPVGSVPRTGQSGRRIPLRLRQHAPEGRSWLQAAVRPIRTASSTAGPRFARMSSGRACSTGPRVSLDVRHTSGNSAGARDRPQAARKPVAGRRSSSVGKPPRPSLGQHRHAASVIQHSHPPV